MRFNRRDGGGLCDFHALDGPRWPCAVKPVNTSLQLQYARQMPTSAVWETKHPSTAWLARSRMKIVSRGWLFIQTRIGARPGRKHTFVRTEESLAVVMEYSRRKIPILQLVFVLNRCRVKISYKSHSTFYDIADRFNSEILLCPLPKENHRNK